MLAGRQTILFQRNNSSQSKIMASDTQSQVCLNVAVDHRIRRLFKPVSNDLTEHSNHVSRIKTRGLSLKRPDGEIEVTTQLAVPAFKGGIAVALQQPRHNHPFENGLDAVIENCKTLYALEEIFSAVSCMSLNIRSDVTVVDLLPYIPEDVARIDDATLEESFRTSKNIMLDKEPSVLLCAGRIWLPYAVKSYKQKGDACKLESIGVGQRFGDSPQYPFKARIHREGKRGFVTINRVNGFHPSHAMSHHPHVSRLRQLQILIGAETCGMLRGDWEEKDWMGELRCRCQDVSTAPSESPFQSPRPGSLGKSSSRRNNTKYLPYYQELYCDKLSSIHSRVKSISLELITGTIPTTTFYKTLLSSGLSETCNDATLILRQMSDLQQKGWPDSVAWKNKAALGKAASCTDRFTKDLLRATGPVKHTQFAKIIQEGGGILLESVTRGSGRRFKDVLDFNKAWNAFLKMATKVETLLMDLLLEEEKALYALGQEESLSTKMERMDINDINGQLSCTALLRISHA